MTGIPPSATMRLQLHKGFTFADAMALVPYLAGIGVSHLYASPILTARAGSIHGYDVVDPATVNPELGGEAGLRALVAALRRAGLGLIVDIVPNHMAVGSDDNAWWTDVLRHGRASRYAHYFDIDWDSVNPLLHGKVLAPFLGKPYGDVLRDGDIRLDRGIDEHDPHENDAAKRDTAGHAEGGGSGGRDGGAEPVIRCYGTAYPINPADHAEIAAAPPGAYDPATPEGRARLHRLLERQHYRLAWWVTAADEINWRRFFDINGLAGLRIERPDVFKATHATLFRLYEEGLIDGFRIDHVDGLSDPPGYCRCLRARLDELGPRRPAGSPPGPAYIVVEKILGPGEHLPRDWGVDGTSGYDFMDQVSLLQHDQAAAPLLSALWAEVSDRPADFATEEQAARREILERGFEAQLSATAAAFHALALVDPATRDLSRPAIRRALIDLLAHFPVYRGYNAGEKRSGSDDRAFSHAFAAARADSPAGLHPVLDQLDRWLGRDDQKLRGAEQRRIAVTRFQQLSAPVAAKAVEDTAFYRYGRLLSRNDVGFAVARLGTEPDTFHTANQARLAAFPASMLATATHDHKRGEDLRARLAVLSEIPELWAETVRGWLALHRAERILSDGDKAMLYQMIVGAWPLDLDADDDEGCHTLAERLAGWQCKALREAKLATDWTAPNTAYEEAARAFLFAILDDRTGFRAQAASLVQRIAPAGAVNSLAQTVLKLTVPGVADFYQGTEFWDFSLVDPDNRRPVDFAARVAALEAGKTPAALIGAWRDGRVKQAVIGRILALRRDNPGLFAGGSYQPVAVAGEHARRIVAFARIGKDTAMLVIVPRLISSQLNGMGGIGIPAAAWGNTMLDMPPALADRAFTSILTHDDTKSIQHATPVGRILRELPLAVLHG